MVVKRTSRQGSTHFPPPLDFGFRRKVGVIQRSPQGEESIADEKGRSAPPQYEPNRSPAYANRRGYGCGDDKSLSAIFCTISQLCWVGENLPLTCTVQP